MFLLLPLLCSRGFFFNVHIAWLHGDYDLGDFDFWKCVVDGVPLAREMVAMECFQTRGVRRA
jgi:hypothetical protein